MPRFYCQFTEQDVDSFLQIDLSTKVVPYISFRLVVLAGILCPLYTHDISDPAFTEVLSVIHVISSG